MTKNVSTITRLRLTVGIFFVLQCLHTGIAAEKDSSNQMEQWVRDANGAIERIERNCHAADVLLSKLQDAGMPANRDDERFLTWLQDTSDSNRELFMDLVAQRHRIRSELIDLWSQVAEPAPITSFKNSDLQGRELEVLDSYRKFLRIHANQKQAVVIREVIPRLIETLDSPYCLAALHILERWVAFIDPIIVTHWRESTELTAESRKNIAARLQQWYQEKRERLVWDDTRNKFVEGRPFAFPEITITPKLQVEERPTNKPAIPLP
jgi:hypothetical protein